MAKMMTKKMPKGGARRRRFDDGGEVPEGGRFSEDTYSRARKFVESGGEDEEAPKAKPVAKKPVTKPSAKASDTTSSRKVEDSEPEAKPKSFSRLAGPAEGSRADKAVKAGAEKYPGSDDHYYGLKSAGKYAAAMAAPAALGAAARGVGAVARGAQRVADIPRQAGQRVGGRFAGRNSPLPSLSEDVGSAMSSDVAAIRRGMAPTGRGAARAAQQMAGVRAGSRMAGRSAALAGAGEAGETAGKAISARMEKDRAARRSEAADEAGMKRGGKVKKYARGGGIEQRGKTRGKMR